MSIIADDNDFNGKNVVTHGHQEVRNDNIKPETTEYDKNFENSTRPKSFDTYIANHN